ncbi:MAG TPA: metallophosphoesterase family protein [Armatimonadota bacterium]|nr:metallophosphoesterase family protein [Armatimonadota bacterium]
MRIAFIFDIHGNLPGLEATLAAIGSDAPDAIYHGGDLIGWGPQPNEVVERIREAGISGVVGNHELLALGAFTEEHPLRNASTAWTTEQLTEPSRAAISELPGLLKLDGALLAHSSPAAWTDPPAAECFPYVHDSANLMRHPPGFSEAPGGIIITGHVHEPAVYIASLGGMAVEKQPMPRGATEMAVRITPDQSAFVVAGAAGKPRDRVLGANYVLLEERTIILRRVSYDVASVAQMMRETDLPDALAEQLMEGV